MFLFRKSTFQILLLLLIIDYRFSMKTLRIKSNLNFQLKSSFNGFISPRFICSNRFNDVTNKAQLVGNDINSIQKSATILINGGLVAFPTETVYGLGANAFNETAVQSIFTTKKRPNSDPLIVHVKNKDLMFDLFDFNSCSNTGNELAKSICEVLSESFWPGPLTIIYKAISRIPAVVTASTGYVGIRCPNHIIALKLLDATNLPIAAPSANRFGHVSPTTSAHVMHDLGDSQITIIEDDVEVTGGCKVGIESTVCRIKIIEQQKRILYNHQEEVKAEISILRCGAITSTLITKALYDKGILNCIVKIDNEKHLIQPNKNVISINSNENSSISNDNSSDSNDNLLVNKEEKHDDVIVAPGQMIKHYAPDLPTYIAIINQQDVITHNNNYMNESSFDSLSAIIKNDYKDLQNAMIIDYGGRLKSLQYQCKVYSDLSYNNNINNACFHLFNELRRSESQDMIDQGVTHVLLPDLRSLFQNKSTINNNNNLLISSNSSSNSNDGLERALWERMNRAASNTFVFI